MNRRMTGWLAWGALALVIGVPSADLVFSTPETSVSVAAIEAEKQPFFGPMPAEKPSVKDAFEAPFTQSQPVDDAAEAKAMDEAMLVPVTPTAVTPTKPEMAVVTPAEPKAIAPNPLRQDGKAEPVSGTETLAELDGAEPKQSGTVMTPVVPMAIRVVGDQRMAPLPLKTEPDAGTMALTEAKTGVEMPAKAAETAATATLQQDTPPLELRGSDNKTINVAVTPPVSAPAPVLAPRPLPAALRPPEPVRTARAAPSFEEEVRASIDNLRTARRGVPVYEDSSKEGPVWGDDPRLRRGQQLESFPPRDFAEDDATDSEFYELWREEQRPMGFRRSGSFEEQLPARRGSGIRMDLLQ